MHVHPQHRRRSAARLAALAAISAALVAAAPLATTPASAAPDDGAVVQAAASALALDAATYEAGATLTATYATDVPDATNWIGIYGADETPGAVPSTLWSYAGDATGTVELVLDLPAGDYAAWFLAVDGYEPLAEPVAFAVTADPDAPVPGDPNAPVTIDPVATDVSTDGVVDRETFDAGLPADWTTSPDDAAGAIGWAATTRSEWSATVDQMRSRFARAHGAFAVADAQQAGVPLEASMTSAPVDVDGLAAVRLTFDSHYRGAAGQAGTVLAAFDGGTPVEVLRLDGPDLDPADIDAAQLNAMQDVVVAVPDGAADVRFTWTFAAPDGGRYWAIDSPTVHQVQQEADSGATQAWIVSDIQGHPADLQHGIGDLAALAPDADGLLMVGDIVASGTEAEWDEVDAVMAATTDVRPPQTIAAIGNHERYAAGGFDANRDRFLQFAQRDSVWDEYVLGGPGGEVPVIVLGQEFAAPSDVAMSDAQVAFLEERLAHWTALDRQVVVITHFPLGDTVSASWIPGYHEHHQQNDRLTSILGNYPNAVVFTGHTHYPAEQGDWAVQRRTDDGHADGFWAVNTMAVQTEWDAVGEDTASVTEVTTRDVNRGIVLDVLDDRLVVTAHDFQTDAVLRQVTIPNPLVPFDEQLAAPVVTPEPTDPPVDPAPAPDPTPSEAPAPSDGATPTDEPTPPASGSDADAVTGQGGSLPQTGADGAWIALVVAAALAAIGGGLLLHRRRRDVG